MVRSTRLIVMNATDEQMVNKAKTNKQAQSRLYEQAQVHLSDCRSSLRHINANQHLSTALSRRSQLLEFTEIVLKYSSMMQHYNAVHFDRAIQRWMLSLPIYIYYELLTTCCTLGTYNISCICCSYFTNRYLLYQSTSTCIEIYCALYLDVVLIVFITIRINCTV